MTNRGPVPSMVLPVDNTVCLFGANDAKSIDSCVGRSKMWMLAWSPTKTSTGALAAAEKLAHTGHRRETKGRLVLRNKF